MIPNPRSRNARLRLVLKCALVALPVAAPAMGQSGVRHFISELVQSGPMTRSVDRARHLPAPVWQQANVSAGCPGWRLAAVPISGAAGALFGWLVFQLGPGAAAADHGAAYRNLRRKFVLGGTTIGAMRGVYQAIVMPCPQPRPRG